jgi:hypothetical protein
MLKSEEVGIFVVLWVMILCSLVADYQHFEGTYDLHRQDRCIHGITTQKTTIHIFTAVKTLNIINDW